MSDEETQIFVARKARRRERWTKTLIITALGTVFAGILCVPIIMSLEQGLCGYH